MKRIVLKISNVLLTVCLLIVLFPAAAFAVEDEYYDVEWDGTQGSWSEWDWATPDGMSIGYSCVDDGLLPSGISLDVPGSNVQPVSGTPKEYGNFYTTILVRTGMHDYHVSIRFCIDEADYGKSEVYDNDRLSGRAGTALGTWNWGTLNGENISDLYISDGTLPAGLYIPTPGSNAFSICGTPSAAGTGAFTVCVETYDTIYYVNISYDIAAAQQEFKVTKSPTEEDIREGTSATFIASANNYNYVEWLLISGGNTVGTYRGESNTNYGSCTVITYKNNGREYLVLRDVPVSMNGFMVQARFTNNAKGSILSQACALCVEPTATPAPTATPKPTPSPTPAPDLKAPVISTQPKAVTQTVGNNTVIFVTATDPNGGALNYQWYSNTAATSTGATAINGANQASYTPPQTYGTMYYYCSITSTKDGKISPATTCTPVAVTYITAEASPSPSSSDSPAPDESPAVSPDASINPEASPSPTPAATNQNRQSRGSVIIILLGVLIVLAAACLVCQIIYIGRRNQGKAVPLVKWDCPECGKHNKAGTHFCSECGAKNPRLRTRK